MNKLNINKNFWASITAIMNYDPVKNKDYQYAKCQNAKTANYTVIENRFKSTKIILNLHI